MSNCYPDDSLLKRAGLLRARRARRSPPVVALIAAGEETGLVTVSDLHSADRNLRIWTRDCPDFWQPESAAKLDYVALVLAFFYHVPVSVLKTNDWYLLVHQCAGFRTEYHEMVALPLQPRPNVRHALLVFARRYFESHLGWYALGEEALSNARASLAQLGLPSSVSDDKFVEAFYSADATQSALDRVAIDPPDLLAITGGHPEIATICVLAPNSD
jgi:hypothetical protein